MPTTWQDMIGEIRRLDPKPGAGADVTPAPLLVPDVLLRPARMAAGYSN